MCCYFHLIDSEVMTAIFFNFYTKLQMLREQSMSLFVLANASCVVLEHCDTLR